MSIVKRLTALATKDLCRHKAGRPRLGTEEERLNALLDHALTIFMRDGYAFASIAKIATAAGVSTRTIYERYQNKADLMVAAVSRMIEEDMQAGLNLKVLQGMPPAEALYTFGLLILGQVTSQKLVQLYRMGVAEAFRFPELVAKMQAAIPRRVENIVGDYLKNYRSSLRISDVDQAARLFVQMVIAEPRHKSLFGLRPDAEWTGEEHVRHVVDVFLHGVLAVDGARNDGEAGKS